MEEPGLTIGSQGEVWRQTEGLRFVQRPGGMKVLQQRWQNLSTGRFEWRDVPLEVE